MEPPRALGSDTSDHYAESLLKVSADLEDVERLDRLINGLAPSFINESIKLQVAIDSTRSRTYFRFLRDCLQRNP